MALPSLDPCSPPDLRHLRRLTDSFGVFQHTDGEGTPLTEYGYATDDVARALIVVLETMRLFSAPARERPKTPEASADGRTLQELSELYLKFLGFCQLPDGRVHNFVAVDRTFQDDFGSLDAHGRTVWALGVTWASAPRQALRDRAADILRKIIPHAVELAPPHSRAFALLGFLRLLSDDDPFGVRDAAVRLAESLVQDFRASATDDWPWFEDTLRYSNGALPYALLVAAGNSQLTTHNSKLVGRAREVGLQSLDFLLWVGSVDGVPAPVGNKGWYPRGGPRALYDQQPVDVAALVVASAEAFRATKEKRFREAAEFWWQWFFGNNLNGISLYRPEDGGVYDGLLPEGRNLNRGAESVVAFNLGHLKLAEAFCEQRPSVPA